MVFLIDIDTYEKTFEKWEEIHNLLNSIDGYNGLRSDGLAILRYKNMLIQKISKNSYKTKIDGYNVNVVNSCILQSEIGSYILEEDDDVCLIYYEKDSSLRCSLRSKDSSPDVSKIAEKFSGGGHRNAAGFFVKNSVIGDIVNNDINKK